MAQYHHLKPQVAIYLRQEFLETQPFPIVGPRQYVQALSKFDKGLFLHLQDYTQNGKSQYQHSSPGYFQPEFGLYSLYRPDAK